MVQAHPFAPRGRCPVELGARLDNEQANWVANPTKTMVVNTARDLIRSGGREQPVSKARITSVLLGRGIRPNLDR